MLRSRPYPRSHVRLMVAAFAAASLGLAASTAAAAPPASEPGAAGAQAATGTTEPFVEDQVLYAVGDGGYACFRIPAVIRTKAGTLLAFAEARVADCGDDGDIDLVLRRSQDEGRTWGPIEMVDEGKGETHGNPVPIVDQRTGRIVLATTRNGPEACQGCDRDPWVSFSDDDGVTWAPPRELTEGKRDAWNQWYATGPGHGIQLTRGPHAGRIVVGGNHESTDAATGQRMAGLHLLYSDDAGQTWVLGAVDDHVDAPLRPNEVTLVELTDGTIYAFVRDSGTADGTRSYAVSRDGGLTFAGPAKARTDVSLPQVEASVLRFSAEDAGDGRDRILLSAPHHGGAREVMSVRSSYDEMRTFDTWQTGGKVLWWGPAAYSDLVRLAGDGAAAMYEAGVSSPYESIRFARFNEAWLSTANGEPPNAPPPPAPGPTTPDLSKADNPAYVRGKAAVVEGKFGNGLGFDGSTWVEVPYDESIDAAGDDFTFATWFRYAETSGRHTILWAHRTGSGNMPQLWLRTDPAANRITSLLVTPNGTSNVSTQKAYNDGRWHHIVLQRQRGRYTVTVDGTDSTSAVANPGSITASKDLGIWGLHLGQRVDGANRFKGTLDEPRFYRRALSASELERIRTHNADAYQGRALGLRLPLDSVKAG